MTPERKRLLRIIRIIALKKRFAEVLGTKDHYEGVERQPSSIRYTFNMPRLSTAAAAYIYVKGHLRKRRR